MNYRQLFSCLAAVILSLPAVAEDGYDLWLRYPAADARESPALESNVRELVAAQGSATRDVVQRELLRGLSGLAGRPLPLVAEASQPGALFFGTPDSSPVIRQIPLGLERAGSEGYVIRSVSVNGRPATMSLKFPYAPGRG